MAYLSTLTRWIALALGFCLGPVGGTVLFAILTGALFSRFEWFGLAMAGMVGLLVSSRLILGEDGAYGGHGVATLRLHLRVMAARDRESREHRAARMAEAERRRETYSFANTASLAMVIVGLAMFMVQIF